MKVFDSWETIVLLENWKLPFMERYNGFMYKYKDDFILNKNVFV